jgi:hypothetical protein
MASAQGHGQDKHRNAPVCHGEDRFKLFVPKRAAANLRPGQTGSGQDREPGDCLAQRPKGYIPDVKPNQFITVKEGKGIISAQPIVFSKTGSPQSSTPAFFAKVMSQLLVRESLIQSGENLLLILDDRVESTLVLENAV